MWTTITALFGIAVTLNILPIAWLGSPVDAMWVGLVMGAAAALDSYVKVESP